MRVNAYEQDKPLPALGELTFQLEEAGFVL